MMKLSVKNAIGKGTGQISWHVRVSSADSSWYGLNAAGIDSKNVFSEFYPSLKLPTLQITVDLTKDTDDSSR